MGRGKRSPGWGDWECVVVIGGGVVVRFRALCLGGDVTAVGKRPGCSACGLVAVSRLGLCCRWKLPVEVTGVILRALFG